MENFIFHNSTLKDRKKSNLVKTLLNKVNLSPKYAALYLGTSLGYFNNKLTRNSFSFEDLIQIAYGCGYSFALVSNKNEQEIYKIDAKEFLGETFIEDTYDVIRKNKLIEYESKKAELEKMKEEYGF